MFLLRSLSGRPGFTALTWLALALMAPGCLLAALAAAWGWPLTGLGERLTQASYLVWLFVLCLSSLRRAATGRAKQVKRG